MDIVSHAFSNFAHSKTYAYDALSNITGITTNTPQNALPQPGQIGGPVNHEYDYDDYNRLVTASGNYTGPNDLTTPYLRQEYTLTMKYNTDHTIDVKEQYQKQGKVSTLGGQMQDEVPVYKTATC